MRYKKIIVPKYIFRDELGTFEFSDIELLIDSDCSITPETFNQEHDDYSISSEHIERMVRESGHRFFNDKYKKILKEEYSLTPREVNGIRLFLGVNGTELAQLLHLDKSCISRILSGKQEPQKDTMVLLMEIMNKEIDTPGITRILLEQLVASECDEPSLQELNLPASLIAEWFIRKFIELEECITNLKLQKLLYYAQGIGFSRYDCKLFGDDIFAWRHGPVVPKVYHDYKPFAASPLALNPGMDIQVVDSNKLAVKILQETIKIYGKYSAWILQDKTHGEKPWRDTPRDNKISDELMKEFFKSVLC